MSSLLSRWFPSDEQRSENMKNSIQNNALKIMKKIIQKQKRKKYGGVYIGKRDDLEKIKMAYDRDLITINSVNIEDQPYLTEALLPYTPYLENILFIPNSDTMLIKFYYEDPQPDVLPVTKTKHRTFDIYPSEEERIFQYLKSEATNYVHMIHDDGKPPTEKEIRDLMKWRLENASGMELMKYKDDSSLLRKEAVDALTSDKKGYEKMRQEFNKLIGTQVYLEILKKRYKEGKFTKNMLLAYKDYEPYITGQQSIPNSGSIHIPPVPRDAPIPKLGKNKKPQKSKRQNVHISSGVIPKTGEVVKFDTITNSGNLQSSLNYTEGDLNLIQFIMYVSLEIGCRQQFVDVILDDINNKQFNKEQLEYLLESLKRSEKDIVDVNWGAKRELLDLYRSLEDIIYGPI